MNPGTAIPSVDFREALATWWRIGWLSFGGPAGQIALMHRVLVEEKRWIDETRFLHALNYCMLLPGPEAQQLATYVGWLLHGVRGGLIAGSLFVLPGAFAMLLLALAYVWLGDLTVVSGLLFGLKAAVIAIVLQALLRIAGRALTGLLKPALAGAAFLALFVFDLPFPLVVLGAGITGYLAARVRPSGGGQPERAAAAADTIHRPGTRESALAIAALWVVTVIGLDLALGSGSVYTQIAAFFSKMAVVTFGGAYAVLAYVAQQGVEHYQWLQPGEMLDGLGLAETTPGPLILVTQFVGFLAAFRAAGTEPAWLAGVLGAALTTWVTFLPCFLWIFAGAPHVERLRSNRALAEAMAAITAAVVGVIANLALWFAFHALFRAQHSVDLGFATIDLPEPGSLDLAQLLLTLLACVLVFRFKAGMFQVILVSAVLGSGWKLWS